MSINTIFDGFGRPDGLNINGVNFVITPYDTSTPGIPFGSAKLPLGSFRSITPTLDGFGRVGITNTYLQLDTKISVFALDVVGAQVIGHILVGYDAQGTELARVAIPFSALLATQATHVSLTAPNSQFFAAFRLFVPLNNDVYYTNLTFTEFG